MTHCLWLRRAGWLGMMAFACCMSSLAQAQTKDEAPAKPAKGDAAKDAQNLEATITISNLQFQIGDDGSAQGAKDGAPPQIIINGKTVGPEEAEKMLQTILKAKKKGPANPGAKLELSGEAHATKEGKVLIISDGKEAPHAEKPPAPPSTGGLIIGSANLEAPGTIVLNLSANVSDYFVGLECFPADAALRTQLNLPEHQGLIVEQVVPDSPAAKAEIKRFDVLLSANDKKVGEIADLQAVIEEAKEQDVTLKLLRGGKDKTVTVKPAKRPAHEGGGLKFFMSTEEPKAAEGAVEKGTKKMEQRAAGDGNILYRIDGPGFELPTTAKFNELPDDMSITITRKGKSPSTIVVQQGENKWEASEKDLDKLPEKIRGFVGPLVGRYDLMRFRYPNGIMPLSTTTPPGETGPMTAVVTGVMKTANPMGIATSPANPGTGPATFTIAPGTKLTWPQPTTKPGDEKRPDTSVEKRLEAMQRQIDELRGKMMRDSNNQ